MWACYTVVLVVDKVSIGCRGNKWRHSNMSNELRRGRWFSVPLTNFSRRQGAINKVIVLLYCAPESHLDTHGPRLCLCGLKQLLSALEAKTPTSLPPRGDTTPTLLAILYVCRELTGIILHWINSHYLNKYILMAEWEQGNITRIKYPYLLPLHTRPERCAVL